MFDVSFPNNDFTQMIEMTARDNARGYVRPMTASADPRPSVRSAELGREVVTTEPLTMDEKNELDRMAREAGIQDERLGNIEETGGAYATMEEALAAGASVHPPAQAASLGAQVGRPTRASVLAPANTASTLRVPRLPNFQNVQGIDLIRGVVYVDDMEFPISSSRVAEYRRDVMEVVKTEIMRSLEEATSLITTPETAEAESEGPTQGAGVQSEPQGDSA